MPAPALAVVDGRLMDAAEAVVPVADPGLLRGDGVFEVVRVYRGRPFALADHLERMARSARGLRLELDMAAVGADARALLDAAPGFDGLLRLVATRGGRRIGLLEPLPDRGGAVRLATVTYSPTRLLDGIKSLSYAANMLAGRIAVERGADEALLVRPGGRVLEGPTWALFASLDGETLVTPPLWEGILDSITRRRLLRLMDGVAEAPLLVDRLAEVREAFIASTTREVQPVASIDGRELPVVDGPLTREAAERFRAHVAEVTGAA